MSPRNVYRHRDSFSMGNHPLSPAPSFLQATRLEGDDSNTGEYIYRWIKHDGPKISRPMSSYGIPKTDQDYRDAENHKTENKLPLEQAVMHKEFHIEALRGQMRKLISENAAECSLLNDKIQGLQTQVATARAKLQATENELETAHRTNADLEKEIKEVRQDYIERSEDMGRNKRELEKQVKSLQQNLTEKSTLQQILEEKVTSSERNSRALEGRNQELEKEIEKLRRTLAEKSETLENEKRKLQEGIEELSQNFAERSTTMECRQQEQEVNVASLQHNSKSLKSDKRDLEAEIKKLRRMLTERFEALECHNKELEQEVEDLRQTLEERTETLESHKEELQMEVQALRISLWRKSEDLEIREQEREDEVKELQQLVVKTKALESEKRQLQEEIKYPQRAHGVADDQDLDKENRDMRISLLEHSYTLEDYKKLEDGVKKVQQTLTERDEATPSREQEFDAEVQNLRQIPAEKSNALEVRRRQPEEAGRKLQAGLAEKSAVLESNEKATTEALTVQRTDLEGNFQGLKDEESRATAVRLEELEKTLVAQLNEKHATELESLRESFAKELQHIQTAHAAALHEFVGRLEGKHGAAGKNREGNHLLELRDKKQSHKGSKGLTKDRGEGNIRPLMREIFSTGKLRPKSTSFCDHVDKSGAFRDVDVH
ncbi:hypothetical protein PAAG_01303 [Paracoccidioides lutzii Pb01]|uniref:Uncharacterized protein n=1 Tax=Paracoccidioides lutzii (strain ATCC MYA-826 / Pb01) TaxID=502779 RepID=C1GS08_PARBA|nr:hypothetical protein PAAG_01303 [Paracoccidioides lutzii Pb01]EEH38382.2 hypothetical protein PAAG_01303 [Paracoccidioides lutzii Pb01]